MSCQQTSRFITTNSSSQTNSNCKNLNNNSQNHIIIKGNRIKRGVIQQEDPYVFTESVPTTPPVLFNTQKPRTRLNDTSCATNIGKFQQEKLPLSETNGKVATNSNQIKIQASFLTSTTTNTCTAPTYKNNVIQSVAAKASITTNNNCSSKKLTNVCVVRPQLQKQQSHYHHYQQHHYQNYINSLDEHDGDLKSISPPPLYTPPTPSLWQTPLLLDTTTSSSGNTSSKETNVVVQKKSPTTSQNIPLMGTVHAAGSTTSTMNPSLTTTAMAKVAPIIVHAPLAPPSPTSPAQSPNQCLPPSKFHNHTLAQHLQKVECLKKSKKSTDVETNYSLDSTTLKSSSALSLSTATPLMENTANPGKHSENEDLNEIPVNVIFRMGVVSQTNEKSSNNIQLVKPQTEIDTQPQLPPPPQTQPTTHTAPPSSPTSTREHKTNVNKILSTTPASKTNVTKQHAKLQQINTSSIPQQKHNTTTTSATATKNLNSQKHQTPNEGNVDDNDSKRPTDSETSTKIITDDSKTTDITDLKKKSSTHISSKTPRKLNLFLPPANHSFDLHYNWQMGCSTTKGAVAIVKMSKHNIDLDTTNLARATGLPYCLQKYWFNTYDFYKNSSDLLVRKRKSSAINRSLAREERIAVFKQQLRRKAMQLFSTRSLQNLPLQLARRRLLCVDRLLRKYQQNGGSTKGLPANVKRCCVNGCNAYTLEMASHCQQHIVYNAAQHVFLPCTAKFADNTQCRVPVFDINHDLPLCMEHTRKRDAYNRHLYEQRPRKISTNIISMNESIKLMPKLSATHINAAGVTVGIKTKNDQLKQQQQQDQHILQQLPSNNKSNAKGNKSHTSLGNQQARKRKMVAGVTGNPVGRPQKRVKKTAEKCVSTLSYTATTATTTPTTTTSISKYQMPHLSLSNLKRKGSTTSLESIASNSQHSTTSSTSQQPQIYQRQQQQQQHLYSVTPTIANATTPSLAPPALAPLSSGLVGHNLPQHLFSFGHDSQNQTQCHDQQQQHQQLQPINIYEKHSFSASTTNSTATASTPTELRDIISQFSFTSQKHAQADTTAAADVNLLNTNSNSNFTSSGMGSTTSLPTADDFLTQDMLSICENSSASSADTGLGGLSDPELMLGGPEDDIPLGDTHLLEEHDLENVLNSLPEDAFKELFNTVHQDESDEIERAIELADKHLKTLQQTIGSELGDFLDFSDDMLMDNADLCNGSTANTILDTTALFMGGGTVNSTSVTGAANAAQGSGVAIETDIRDLVQT